MENQENKLNIDYSRLFILWLKFTPVAMVILDVIHTILSYYGVYLEIFTYISGVSLLTLAYLYASSYLFKFCELHRIPLHLILVTNLIALIDSYYLLPLSDLNMLRLYLILVIIFALIYIYLKVKNKLCLH